MKSIEALPANTETSKITPAAAKPVITIIVPAYNEAQIIEKNLSILYEYMATLENEYHWELIVVDDGSTDETGALADSFAKTRGKVQVLHHRTNLGLGQALRSAFDKCNGDYVLTMDLDLSYSPEHIAKMLRKIRETGAGIVIASPYMKGGRVSRVPWLRRTLSVWSNRFLSYTVKGKLKTLTGMVRAYDLNLLNSLALKAQSMNINIEIIYKAHLSGAQIVEIPAHLDWSLQRNEGINRKSSMRLSRGILSCLSSGFAFMWKSRGL